MAKRRKLVFHVSTSLATAGAVAAVAVSGCVVSNPAPPDNENVVSNPIPLDLGHDTGAASVNDAGDVRDDAVDSGTFCNPVCPDVGTDAGGVGSSADMGNSDAGDLGGDANDG